MSTEEEARMKLTVEMPEVSECAVSECAYNLAQKCHARAITVGGGIHAACDTFLPSSAHVNNDGNIAGVGACKVASCRHNDDFECRAKAIRVDRHQEHADCVTFEART